MPVNDDIQSAIQAVRRRARELAEAGARDDRTHDAETLAALADGTVSLDDLSDSAIERCIQTFGCEQVVEALVETTANATAETPVQTPAPNAADQDADDQPFMRLVPSEKPMTLQTAHPSAASLRLADARRSWQIQPRWLAMAACILLLIGVAVVTLAPWRGPGGPTPPSQLALTLQWPQDGLDSTGNPLNLPGAQVAQGMPDFSSTGGTLGGSETNETITRWRLATVIVSLENGFGSGAIISPDGWILTNYHVVDSAVQEAAISASRARVQVITAHVEDGRVKPRDPLPATVYRADPRLDLALVKLDRLPEGVEQLPHFDMAEAVREGEDCFVVGSQQNGPAWWVRAGSVSHQFDFPEDLSQVAAGHANPAMDLLRDRRTLIVSDAQVSNGDSGGPLLNADGQLIGLTFATSANRSAGSVGWHVALPHLRSFVETMPTDAEAAPFDPWTAGLPYASMLSPSMVDGDRDGRIDSLRYIFDQRTEQGGEPQHVAAAFFIDFQQRASESEQVLDHMPHGLWGMEDRGNFHFDLMLIARADGVAIVGYTNADGIVDEMRIGRTGSDQASVIWTRGAEGHWQVRQADAATPMLDPQRISEENLRRLGVVSGRIVAPARGAGEDGLPGGKGTRPGQQDKSPLPGDDRRNVPNAM